MQKSQIVSINPMQIRLLSAHRKLSSSILNSQHRQAFWPSGLFLGFVQCPNLQNGLIGKIFGNGHEERCTVDLFHVRNRSRIVRLKGLDDLKGFRQDPNVAIAVAEEQIVRSRTQAAKLIALATSATVIFLGFKRRTNIKQTRAFCIWGLHFRHIEEVERFPLSMTKSADGGHIRKN